MKLLFIIFISLSVTYSQCDANYDGNIDVIDVVLIVNMILGNQELELEVSDLNNDQELNVVDIVILVNLILSVQ